VFTNQSGPSGQICLTFSNAKVSVNLTISHPLILTLIIPILGNNYMEACGKFASQICEL